LKTTTTKKKKRVKGSERLDMAVKLERRTKRELKEEGVAIGNLVNTANGAGGGRTEGPGGGSRGGKEGEKDESMV